MSIGFKEWALVCEALGNGRQSIILRKGGIAEGREGFRFQHDRFFLFPTLFHEQLERTTLPAGTILPAFPPDVVRIEFMAEVRWTKLVQDLEALRRISDFHILQPSVIEERFRYDEPHGVNVALVRAFRLPRPWEFPMKPAYGGCRSWVQLNECPEAEISASQPVLSDEAHSKIQQALMEQLGEAQPE